jgi:septum formation protein
MEAEPLHYRCPLFHLLRQRPVYLASSSPRRRALLQQIGIEPDVFPAQIEEYLDPKFPPEQQVCQLANMKAAFVLERISAGIVVAADTVVLCEGEMMGKPRSEADARRMLIKLSGENHIVLTGVCVAAKPENRSLSGAARTKVTFETLTSGEIEHYMAVGKVLDKAGAYGIQDIAGMFVSRLEGSYSSVVGLPLELVRRYLVQALSW